MSEMRQIPANLPWYESRTSLFRSSFRELLRKRSEKAPPGASLDSDGNAHRQPRLYYAASTYRFESTSDHVLLALSFAATKRIYRVFKWCS